MDEQKEFKREVMDINWEQQRILSNPVRARLVAYLFEKAMTPKQAADLLGKNPGTVYYHIQQLAKHGLLEVERIDTTNGVVEKYYRAKANAFRNPEKVTPPGQVDQKATTLYMSKKLLEQFSKEFEDLLFKYGHLSHEEKDVEEQKPYLIEFLIQESKEEE